MASSWADMGGGTDVFALGADWKSAPTQTLEPYRTIIQYPGSGIKIRDITDDIQIKFSMHMGNMNKAGEYNLLSYFAAHRGRANAFWLPMPKNYWTMRGDMVPGFLQYVPITDAQTAWLRGYERMFVLLNNGDYIGRKILSIGSQLILLNTAADRVVHAADVNIIGKLLLCRFDQDELELSHTSSALSDCDISFCELPKEYPA